ncbi:Cupredoxin-like domain-containing protein [Mesorhizobium albiziae]|uniref:Cupredoxin-like domain-containing protein n=2 Tax=Neomesorhizobium albiziae TaxID=335020 RepID=A0A1I3YY12_9HYPH|nr:hypothetical protein GCM10007937_49180 [Mesorhizobium albiziae]SFK36670.1 Cupredoxin-like domain-containing protein [Mesorhizobium albiziae]
MLIRHFPLAAAAAAVFAWSGFASQAAETPYTLTIKDHRFRPETLTVPAGKEFTLVVINSDPTAEELESNDFHVEKVIAGGKQATFQVGPLTAGTYGFFGERHMDTALGNLFAE